jgi:cytochrome c556
MRLALLVPFALLAACGGPETSQANNSSANIGNSASPPPTANAGAANGMSMLAAAPTPAAAHKIMHERHEGMESIGKNFKALRRELDSSAPNLAAVRSSAATIANLSQKASGWFPRGTGPDVGKTGAKPEIWQSNEDFTAKLRSFQAAAKAFNATAASGNVAAIKARYGDLGGTCKACHDKYRAEMKH